MRETLRLCGLCVPFARTKSSSPYFARIRRVACKAPVRFSDMVDPWPLQAISIAPFGRLRFGALRVLSLLRLSLSLSCSSTGRSRVFAALEAPLSLAHQAPEKARLIIVGVVRRSRARPDGFAKPEASTSAKSRSLNTHQDMVEVRAPWADILALPWP